MTDAILTPALRDELRRAGPADIVLALPTSADAAAVDHAIGAFQVGLARLLPGTRAIVLTVGESAADAPPLTSWTPAPDAVVAALLRPPAIDARRVHLATAGARDRAMAVAFEAAAAVDAALVLMDGDLRWAVPEWLDALATPLLEDRADLVLPQVTRHRFDGVLDAIAVAPVTRALYGRRVRRMMGVPLGVGRALLGPLRAAGDGAGGMVAVTTAIAEGRRVVASRLGVLATDPAQRELEPIAGARRAIAALLAATTPRAATWLAIRGSEDLPALGFPRPGDAPPVRVDPVRWLGTFAEAAATHREAWAATLSTATLNAVLGLAVTAAGVGLSARDWLNLDRGADIGRLDTVTLAGAMATFQFPDEAWVRIVHDALVAAGPGGRSPDEVAGALAPVALGRAASFVVEAGRARPDEVTALFERQALAFERLKPELVARWSAAEAGADERRAATIA